VTRGGALGLRGRIAIGAGTPVVRALALTWRFAVRNERVVQEARASGRGFVFSLWHGEMLPLLWLHRNQGVRVLISEHRDGELIARIAESFGFRTVRGSSSRGGERALLAIASALEKGEEVAFTPDGPRGPARVSQAGAMIAAARAQTVIVPAAVHAAAAWRLGSWDRFLVPRPFARVTVAYGEPLHLSGMTAREAAAQTARLDDAMTEAAGIAAR
jgi:lysophospholipid acyltransferase (LPLAT)-like uncharacterized protein